MLGLMKNRLELKKISWEYELCFDENCQLPVSVCIPTWAAARVPTIVCIMMNASFGPVSRKISA